MVGLILLLFFFLFMYHFMVNTDFHYRFSKYVFVIYVFKTKKELFSACERGNLSLPLPVFATGGTAGCVGHGHTHLSEGRETM